MIPFSIYPWLLSLLSYAVPTVRLGQTTLRGLDLPLLGLEFFGGPTLLDNSQTIG